MKMKTGMLVLLVQTSALLVVASSAVADVAKFEVTGDDQMKYNLTELKVKAGQQVEIILKNIGALPKAAMGHNLIVLKQGVDVTEFVTACATQVQNEYFDPARKNDVIAMTKMLGPGESETLKFTAPAKAGKYDYVCSFPGHAIAGMRGVLIVE